MMVFSIKRIDFREQFCTGEGRDTFLDLLLPQLYDFHSLTASTYAFIASSFDMPEERGGTTHAHAHKTGDHEQAEVR